MIGANYEPGVYYYTGNDDPNTKAVIMLAITEEKVLPIMNKLIDTCPITHFYGFREDDDGNLILDIVPLSPFAEETININDYDMVMSDGAPAAIFNDGPIKMIPGDYGIYWDEDTTA